MLGETEKTVVKEGQEVLQNFLTSEYWNMHYALPGVLRNDKSSLTSTESKIVANVFERGVHKIMTDEARIFMPEGYQVDIDDYPVGTMLLMDIETLRRGVAPSSGTQIDCDPDYPGQLRYYMNCSAQDLINLNLLRHRQAQAYAPARMRIADIDDQWQYSRLAWFGVIVPTESGKTISSFSSASPNRPTKDLFQHGFGISDELIHPAIIGQTTLSTVRDPAWNNARQYQRLRELVVYTETSKQLARNVYKQHHSAKRLGKRALKNLSSACLVGNSE